MAFKHLIEYLMKISDNALFNLYEQNSIQLYCLAKMLHGLSLEKTVNFINNNAI